MQISCFRSSIKSSKKFTVNVGENERKLIKYTTVANICRLFCYSTRKFVEIGCQSESDDEIHDNLHKTFRMPEESQNKKKIEEEDLTRFVGQVLAEHQNIHSI
jgi:hypothetical protein